jgi:hypothetical protein
LTAFAHELGRRAEFLISVVEVATFGAALVAAKGKNTARQDRGPHRAHGHRWSFSAGTISGERPSNTAFCDWNQLADVATGEPTVRVGLPRVMSLRRTHRLPARADPAAGARLVDQTGGTSPRIAERCPGASAAMKPEAIHCHS